MLIGSRREEQFVFAGPVLFQGNLGMVSSNDVYTAVFYEQRRATTDGEPCHCCEVLVKDSVGVVGSEFQMTRVWPKVEAK